MFSLFALIIFKFINIKTYIYTVVIRTFSANSTNKNQHEQFLQNAKMNTLKAFSAVFFAHPIAQMFRSLNPQGLRVGLTFYFLFPIFKNKLNSC